MITFTLNVDHFHRCSINPKDLTSPPTPSVSHCQMGLNRIVIEIDMFRAVKDGARPFTLRAFNFDSEDLFHVTPKETTFLIVNGRSKNADPT